MGQKTHPVGFRLNVNKAWSSTWFAEKNNFAESLEEDVKIRRYISFLSLIHISEPTRPY